jgi:hypothetical protein
MTITAHATVAALISLLALSPAASAQQAQPPAAPPQVPHPMGFFVTGTTPNGSGNLGGLAGADKICQDLASAAGAGQRTWHAYLSTLATQAGPGVNARDRIGAGPWYNAKNVLIAANVEDLHGDRLRDRNDIQKATALTETGETIKGAGDTPNQHDILTGSDSDGRAFPAGLDTTCDNWTSDGDDHKAMLGHADRTGGQNISWNSTHMSRGCSAASLVATGGAGHFYCFAAD